MKNNVLNGFMTKGFSFLVFFGLLFYTSAVFTQSDKNYNPLPPTHWEGDLREISPQIPLRNSPDAGIHRKVRLVYLVPTNKMYNELYRAEIANAILHLKDFYRQELGSNYEFTLNDPIVEVHFTSHDTSWYQNNPSTGFTNRFWNNVVIDGIALTGATSNDKWLFYVDADPLCGQTGGAAQVNGPFGVLPANDLRGLTGQQNIPPCSSDPPDNGGKFRWIGGLGHELGHTFGLPHPPGCGGSGPNYGCTGGQTAANSIMWVGYAFYPNTYLLPSDKTICINSGFFSIPPAQCTYSVNQTGIGVPEIPASGAIRSFSVNAQNGCAWTAASSVPWIIVSSGGSGSGSGTVTVTISTNPGPARSGTVTIAGQAFSLFQQNGTPPNKTPFDFNGDGKTDYAVVGFARGVSVQQERFWFILINSTNEFRSAQWGLLGDLEVPADYDGDGITDIAVFRGGNWYLLRSRDGFIGVQFGQAGDIPMPANYDGDGRADIAVFRPSNGSWYLLQSSQGFAGVQFGQNGDKPVAADFDGDGKADLAVYRNGNWYVLQSALGFAAVNFGIASDKAVPADFDGDGKADIAVFRSGTWYLLRSQLGFLGISFGIAEDKPVVGDYDGDGKADIAVWRPSTGAFYVLQSQQGFTAVGFGQNGDVPVSSAFVR